MFRLKSYKNTIAASLLGGFSQAIGASFAPLLFITFQNTYNLSLSQLSLLVTVNFATQLLTDLVASKAVDKLGYRPCIVAAFAFSAIGFAGLGIFPDLFGSPLAGLLTAVVIYAVGAGLIEVMVSPIVEACPTKNKEGFMSFLHSAYCWGVLLTVLLSTLFFSTAGIGNWRILAYLWAIVPVVTGIYFLFVPIYPIVTHNEGGLKIKQLFGRKIFWLAAAMMLCSGASEIAVAQWASAFAESGLGISKATADLLAPCMFALMMGISRVLNAKFSSKINLSKTLLMSSVLCVIAYILTVFSPWAWLSLVGCALCGFSVGIMWPGVISIASKRCPRGGTTMFAMLALAGDLGGVCAPAMVGIVADAAGGEIKWGILSAIIFPVLLIIGAIVLLKGKNKKTGIGSVLLSENNTASFSGDLETSVSVQSLPEEENADDSPSEQKN